MQKLCKCTLYDDIPLNLDAIKNRAEEYKKMRTNLKQISQKVIERWSVHYRLYRCEECDQYWQSSLDAWGWDKWYLFKVPKITQKHWKEKPYVDPAAILAYLQKNNVISPITLAHVKNYAEKKAVRRMRYQDYINASCTNI